MRLQGTFNKVHYEEGTFGKFHYEEGTSKKSITFWTKRTCTKMSNLVVPRVSFFEEAERVPLIDVIERMLYSEEPRVVRLQGVDSVAALESLKAAFAHDDRVHVCDSPKFGFGELEPYRVWIHNDPTVASKHTLTIAPWDRDDVIQYMLAVAPKECRSVLGRIQPQDFAMVRGGTAVWKSILDAMLSMPNEHDFMTILKSILVSKIPRSTLPFTRRESIQWLGDQFLHPGDLTKLLMLSDDPVYLALLHIPRLRLAIAVERFAYLLESSNKRILQTKHPSELLVAVSQMLKGSIKVEAFLKQCVYQGYASMAVSLLSQMDLHWKPEPSKNMDLQGAYLSRAAWEGVRLQSTKFGKADLSNACLDNSVMTNSEFLSDRCDQATWIESTLHGIKATTSSFVDANFFRAKLESSQWRECDLQMANFAGARLSESVFQKCDLSDVSFRTSACDSVCFYECKLSGADFTDAQLAGSRMQAHDLREAIFNRTNLTKANLHRAVFGSLAMHQCKFDEANLGEAYLSGSSMKECSLHQACLIHARLAEVQWELCDLRGADLTGATFHYGSTRCGTVDSPYPSHGTRTGYYTDDRDTLYFQAPEMVRKANLCGCDLRGAKITGVDFYLVDLRDAILDPQQRSQIEASGGILE